MKQASRTGEVYFDKSRCMTWDLDLRGLLSGLLFFRCRNVFNVFNATICRSAFSVLRSGVRCCVTMWCRICSCAFRLLFSGCTVQNPKNRFSTVLFRVSLLTMFSKLFAVSTLAIVLQASALKIYQPSSTWWWQTGDQVR